jgi:hypothetical protein
MNNFLKFCTVSLLIFAGSFAAPVYSAGTDIFLVYVGADKKIQKSVKSALPAELKVKTYNASLLAMADYSGKQKAVSKITKAKLVVFITGKPVALLSDSSIPNSVTIEGDAQAEVDKIVSALP